jgi:putative transposase
MSGGNLAGVKNMNSLLMLNGRFRFIDILQVKYLNNINEQYNRFMKKITRPMKGFKAFHSAPATLEGIKIAHMIRKKKFTSKGRFSNLQTNRTIVYENKACINRYKNLRQNLAVIAHNVDKEAKS